MIKRLAIYPFGPESLPMIRHLSLIKDYKIAALISPKSWGYTGTKYKCEQEILEVQNDFHGVGEKFDVVFIPEIPLNEKAEHQLIRELCKITHLIHLIIVGCYLQQESIDLLKRSTQQNQCLLQFMNNSSLNDHLLIDNCNILECSIPIIAIVGALQNTDKFELSLALREKFLQEGYKLTQIGSRPYCELFGFHSFPTFMTNCQMHEKEKIIYFNRYVYDLVKEEKSDVAIITVPGSTQKLNNKYTNGFGILPFLVFQAIQPDYLIFCTLYDSTPAKLLELYNLSCKYKYGHSVDSFHMSNTYLDILGSDEMADIVTKQVEREYVDLNIQDIVTCYSIFNAYSTSGILDLYNSIISRLSDSAAVFE